MCRIALYTSLGSSRGLREFIESFIEASVNDFVLDSYRRGRRAHNHGWGYAYIYRVFNDLGVMHFRTSLPITSASRRAISIPRRFNWLSMIIHSRLTSAEPIDLLSSHPFHTAIPGRLSIWLVHNGAVDKGALAREMSMDNLTDMYADSYFLTQWIARNLEKPGIEHLEKVVRGLIELGITRTSLNFIALILDEKEKNVFSIALNYVCGKGLEMYDYYKLHRIHIDERALAVASATVALYMNSFYGYEIEPLENGEALFIIPQKGRVEVISRKLV